jgi:membrane protein
MASALAPLFILLVISASLLDLDLNSQLADQIRNIVGEDALKIFTIAAESAKKTSYFKSLSGGLGLFTLLLSSSAIFAQLQNGFKIIMECEDKPEANIKQKVKKMIRSQLWAIFMIVLFDAILIMSLALSVVFEFWVLPESKILKWYGFFGDVIVFSLAFSMAFKFLAPIQTKYLDCIISGTISALLFIFGKDLIGVYLRTSTSSTYATAGLPIALLFWLYYSAIVIFFGAEILGLRTKKILNVSRTHQHSNWQGLKNIS